MEQFAFLTGGVVGIIVLISLLYFVTRRLSTPARQVSAAGDYLLVILLAAAVLTGDLMRFFVDVPITVYREYARSLFSLHPCVPTALEEPVARWCLGLHVTCANVLFFCFPFSKLMHFAGTFATNRIRHEFLWLHSYKSS